MPRPFNEAFDISRTLSHAFSAVKAAPLPLILGAVLMQCTESGGGNGGNYSSPSSSDTSGGLDIPHELESLSNQIDAAAIGVIIAIVLCVLVCAFLVFLFRCWVETGYYRLHHEVLATGQGQVGTLFGGRDAMTRMVLWKLLKGVVVFGTTIVAGAPGGILLVVGIVKTSTAAMVLGSLLLVFLCLPVAIYVGLGLWLGDRLVALDGLGAMAALERSWSLASGNRLWMCLYSIAVAIVHLAGLCLCCVGVFFTRALRDVATTEGFLLFTRPDDETSRFWSMQGGL